jgi:Zn-dependent peptidase ImmA (M78 family)
VSTGQARVAAADARRDLGLGDDSPLPDILRLLETAGLRVFGHPLGHDGVDGAYELVRDEPFILFNVAKHPQRIRFTLSHEYGHHRLGHGAKPPEHVRPRSQQPVERDANAFAAAFLMPRAAIGRWLEAHGEPTPDLEVTTRLAAAFGVSAWAMRYRLEDLGHLRRGAPLKRIDTALNAGAHTQLARDLSIPLVRDTVSDAHRIGLWLPVDHQRTLLSLLESGRATEATIARQLPEGVSINALHELAAQHAEEPTEGENGG